MARMKGDFPIVFIMLVAAFWALLASCGGGGGGDVEQTPPTTNLEYTLGGPRAGTAPLTVTGPASKFTLGSDPPAQELPLIRGRWDTDTLDATITGDPDNVIFWADTLTPADGPLFGNLSVSASETFRWNGADNPTAGEFLIRSRDGFFPGTIRAQVTSQGGSAGVLSRYDAGNDGTYESSAFSPWAAFGDLWEDGGLPLYQRVASFVFHTRQATFSAFEFSIEATIYVEDLRADLLAAGSDNAVQVADVCGALPGAPGQPGTFSVTWTDVNGNGQIDYDASGGLWDTFTFAISQCRVDDPDEAESFLLDGVMRLVYYERPFQWGVSFDNFIATSVANDAVVPESAATFNGGFSVMMVTPAQ